MNIIYSLILCFKSNFNIINNLQKRFRNNNKVYSVHNDTIRILTVGIKINYYFVVC